MSYTWKIHSHRWKQESAEGQGQADLGGIDSIVGEDD